MLIVKETAHGIIVIQWHTHI